MSRSERVSTTDSTSLSRRWLLEPALACAVMGVEDLAERSAAISGIPWPGLFILSGHRTANQQAEVNPFSEASHHRCCPSLAVDLRVGDIPVSITPRPVWEEVANFFSVFEVRWGGDFSDPELASAELNHFYLPGVKCFF